MATAFIIWIIGIMFVLGLLDFEWSKIGKADAIIVIVLILCAWPFVLGISIQKVLE